jgi:hypothetical protein
VSSKEIFSNIDNVDKANNYKLVTSDENDKDDYS